jgi:hypothetical protein
MEDEHFEVYIDTVEICLEHLEIQQLEPEAMYKFVFGEYIRMEGGTTPAY